MSSEQSNSSARTHAELSALLCAALTAPRDDVFDALYDAEGEDPSRGELVASMRDETKSMFAAARDKLGGGKLELLEEHTRSSDWVSLVRVEGGPQDGLKLELIVADVFEREGVVHTRDIIELRVVG